MHAAIADVHGQGITQPGLIVNTIGMQRAAILAAAQGGFALSLHAEGTLHVRQQRDRRERLGQVQVGPSCQPLFDVCRLRL